MNILAIDIGAGTQDIMVCNEERGFANAYKLVQPSPTRFFAEEVGKSNEDLVIFGDIMGEGPFTRAILEHLRKYKVYMTEIAARTLRDDLEIVKNYGIEIISEGDLESMSEKAKPIKIPLKCFFGKAFFLRKVYWYVLGFWIFYGAKQVRLIMPPFYLFSK